jgi:sugar phosphate isomerase/epimerase
MRLSGPVTETTADSVSWIASVLKAGYAAAGLPFGPDTDEATVTDYLDAARKAGVLIAEVGAWSNPIDPDPAKAGAAIALCQRQLAWADRIGARCCVNIAGSRNPAKWDGPDPENFSKETFDLIVHTTREIVDAVNPKRTFYALETMPWIFPSSPDEYLALINAIDRPGIAVHLDPVNMINSPMRCYQNGDFIRECFSKLGHMIKSCHAKDIILREHLTVHLDECRPGAGVLDYVAYLGELAKLDEDIPLVMEHMAAEDYPLAADHIRGIARENQFNLKYPVAPC